MWKIKFWHLLGKILIVLGVFLLLYPSLHQNVQETQDGIGYIEIPKLKIYLPIFEGTEEETLEKGVGHISESSYPGRENSHCILAGHRGLPNKDMLLHLDKMSVGDQFYLIIDHEILEYTVCQIQVIKPNNTKSLGVQNGKELVSLVTCTPYGINTHRLVVTGERVKE